MSWGVKDCELVAKYLVPRRIYPNDQRFDPTKWLEHFQKCISRLTKLSVVDHINYDWGLTKKLDVKHSDHTLDIWAPSFCISNVWWEINIHTFIYCPRPWKFKPSENTLEGTILRNFESYISLLLQNEHLMMM